MRSGYTLPVFACASAVAALRWLQDSQQDLEKVEINLIEPPEVAEIPIEQVAGIRPNLALGITRSDPGDNLDLTRQTPVWSTVEIRPLSAGEDAILIEGGEGIGRILAAEGQAAIYRYAQRLLRENLQPLLGENQQIRVTIVLPEGRNLAQRTSNEAFGVVEGLSLLGTSGISQPLTAPGQLELFQAELRDKVQQTRDRTLVFCIGENGLDLAQKMGISPHRLLKTANWLGPMLVEAGLQGVQSLLLFGYHGKLMKLAGGIFHTHHHLADGRLEILTAYGAKVGLPQAQLLEILASATAEDALKDLRQLDHSTGSDWVSRVYGAIGQQIDHRSQAYIQTHAEKTVEVGTLLFDRRREIITITPKGSNLLSNLC